MPDGQHALCPGHAKPMAQPRPPGRSNRPCQARGPTPARRRAVPTGHAKPVAQPRPPGRSNRPCQARGPTPARRRAVPTGHAKPMAQPRPPGSSNRPKQIRLVACELRVHIVKNLWITSDSCRISLDSTRISDYPYSSTPEFPDNQHTEKSVAMSNLIILPSSFSQERSRLLSVNLIRRRALERLRQRKATVEDLIQSLEDYQRCRTVLGKDPCIPFSARRKCS